MLPFIILNENVLTLIFCIYQVSDDDEDEGQLTIDESIAEDEPSPDHIRLPSHLSNSLQLTAASLLGLANGNG